MSPKETRTGVLLLLGLVLIGCSNNPKPASEVVTTGTITVRTVPNEIPRFEKVYTSKVDARCSLTTTLYSRWDGGRVKSGELTQPNGRWVWFDPDVVAEKILDPILVPLVQAKVDEIVALDKAYMDSMPSEFTDEAGVRWRRR